MMVKKYRSIVNSINSKIQGIYTLDFKSLGDRYKYYPGQFLHLAIQENYDGTGQWPESRCFSMQSNPSEDFIRITYAVKGKFTHEMEQRLKIGSEVWLKLAYGNLFTQEHDKENTVFIAGGTGITPFLSLFSDKSFEEYFKPNIYFGCRSRNYNIYQAELGALSQLSNNVRVNIFYNDENGILNIEDIFNENGKFSDYFISGPEGMIAEFRKILLNKGVNSNKIRTDNWE